MDDYVSKPVQREELSSVLEKWSNKGSNEEKNTMESEVEQETMTAPIAVQRALERVEGDREFLGELVDAFLDYAPDEMKALRMGIQAGDASQVEQSAHSLKGAAANLEAEGIRSLAFRLEEMGRDARLDGAMEVLSELEREVARLRDFVGTLQ